MEAKGLLHLVLQDAFPPTQAKISSNPMESPGGSFFGNYCLSDTVGETLCLKQRAPNSHAFVGKESQGSDVGGRFTKNLLISKEKRVEKRNKVKTLLPQGQFFTSNYRILQACPLCAGHKHHDE